MAETVLLRLNVYQDGREIIPAVSDIIFDSSETTGFNKVTVSASAADEAVAISDVGTVKYLELRVGSNDVNKITVKINSSSKAYKVSPVAAYSETISAITASNSSTSAVNLYWRVIYG